MSDLTEFATGVVLLLLVLAIVVFFWRWSQRNTKASAERIKKYQLPLDVDSAGNAIAQGIAISEGPSPEISRELADELDAKTAKLYQLLNSAEEQAARLERAIAEAKRQGL
jgi:hypothetical protein